MKLAIMQPYLFPYIGYFQLMHAVDRFVIYDNVQYKKDGWINRNRIIVNRQDKIFTVPVRKEALSKNINERLIAIDRWPKERRKLLLQLDQNYSKAPFFNEVFPLVKHCFELETESLFDLIDSALRTVCGYLGITTELLVSSKLDVDHALTGQKRVIAICRALKADRYINAPGGRELYDTDVFEAAGIHLQFIESKQIQYQQFKGEFVPWLSIIDVMMFNSTTKIREYLDMYTVS